MVELDDLFSYLVATDQVDAFLNIKKEQIDEVEQETVKEENDEQPNDRRLQKSI